MLGRVQGAEEVAAGLCEELVRGLEPEGRGLEPPLGKIERHDVERAVLGQGLPLVGDDLVDDLDLPVGELHPRAPVAQLAREDRRRRVASRLRVPRQIVRSRRARPAPRGRAGAPGSSRLDGGRPRPRAASTGRARHRRRRGSPRSPRRRSGSRRGSHCAATRVPRASRHRARRARPACVRALRPARARGPPRRLPLRAPRRRRPRAAPRAPRRAGGRAGSAGSPGRAPRPRRRGGAGPRGGARRSGRARRRWARTARAPHRAGPLVPTAAAGSRRCRGIRRRSRSRAARRRSRARARRSPPRRGARPRRDRARSHGAPRRCSPRDTARAGAPGPARPAASSVSRAIRNTISTPRRLRTKQIVRRPAVASAASRPAASASVEPRSPVSSSSRVGCQKATVRGRARGAVLRDDGHVETREGTRQLDRVPDRRRGEQERRRRSVQRTHATQPPQDERHVAAEDTAVDVCLVDDDVREAAKHLGPARVVREDPEVQHVRVREDGVAPLARERSSLAWRVPVVERRPQTETQLRQPPRLILREGLRRTEVQGACAAPLEQLLHEGERVGERLAARRPRDDADVLAGACELVGLGLVRVELGDALRDQRGYHARIDVRGQRNDARERPGLVGAMHESVVVRGRPDREQRLPGLLFAGHRRHRRTLPNVGSVLDRGGATSLSAESDR